MRVATPSVHSAARCDAVIFVAVPDEAAALRRRLRATLHGGDGRLHGEWRGRRVRLQETGTGLQCAEGAARRLLRSARPRLVVCAGLAGALCPSLQRGDVVVAERVTDENGSVWLACDAAAVQAAVQRGARRADLLSASRVVWTVEGKRTLAARAALVDMESLAVARVAAEHGVPFVSLRVISDAAHEGFPVDLNRHLDDHGRVRRVPLVLDALRRPGGLRFLLGMRSTTSRASTALASYVEHLLDALPEASSNLEASP